jgi:hypothetical protein
MAAPPSPPPPPRAKRPGRGDGEDQSYGFRESPAMAGDPVEDGRGAVAGCAQWRHRELGWRRVRCWWWCVDSLADPSRGGFGGESGGDPPRGQHHRVPPGLGGLVGHEVGQCDQISVAGRITNAAPSAGAGARVAITEQLQSAFCQQRAGQGFGRFWLRDGHPRADPVHECGVWCASTELMQFQRPAGSH